MRIVQVTPFFHPHAGGVESHVRALAREFARQGHEVTIVTSRYDPTLPTEASFEGYRILRSRTWGVVFNTPIDVGTRRIVRRVDADVVHLHYPPPLSSYIAVGGLTSRHVPVCLTYHCDLYLPVPGGRVLTALYENLFLRRTLAGVDRVIVHTRSYATTSAVLRGRNIAIIPSSVDVQRFRPDVDGREIRHRLGFDDKRVLAFTGRLVPHKGVDSLLRAMVGLPPDVALLVIGRGSRLPELRALARRLNLLGRVQFASDVSDDELPAYLRAADIFVFPSQNRLEGFGLAVVEAMAAGLPVVITDMPGVREVIEPGVEGVLVEPLIASDLTDRVRELLDDPERRRKMGERARQRAEERYALATVARSLLNLYEDLRAAG
ncbi:MAG: glycosyltransferase family 4 protein [Thermoplasmata archaeon]